MTAGTAPPLSERATVRLLSIGTFTSNFDRFMVASLLVLIAQDFEEPLADVARVATFYFLAYGVMQLAWGILSDRIGRVRTMRLALLLAGLTGVLSTAAPNLDVLLLSRTLAGAAFAAAVPTAMVYVGDTVPLERRQAPVADLMTGGALGMAVSTLGAAVVGDYLHWRVAMAATAVIALGLAHAMRRLAEPEVEERSTPWTSLRRVLGEPWALLVLALAFAEGMVVLGFITYFPTTLQDNGFSATVAGAATTTFGISTMVFASMVKRLDRFGPTRLIAIGAVCAVAAYLAAVLDQRLPGMVAASVLLGAARAFMHSSLQTWVTDVVPQARAMAVSLFATVLFTGTSAAAAVGGAVIAGGGSHVTMYAVALALSVPLGLVATIGRARYHR